MERARIASAKALKPGLVSKSFDVAEWAARLFSKLALEFADSNLLMNAWEWFVGEGQGLSTTLLGLKRHPDLKNKVVEILLQIARYNFVELFTINFKKAVPDAKDLLLFQTQLLSPLLSTKSAQEEVATPFPRRRLRCAFRKSSCGCPASRCGFEGCAQADTSPPTAAPLTKDSVDRDPGRLDRPGVPDRV